MLHDASLPSFWEKFVELNGEMMRANKARCTPLPYYTPLTILHPLTLLHPHHRAAPPPPSRPSARDMTGARAGGSGLSNLTLTTDH